MSFKYLPTHPGAKCMAVVFYRVYRGKPLVISSPYMTCCEKERMVCSRPLRRCMPPIIMPSCCRKKLQFEVSFPSVTMASRTKAFFFWLPVFSRTKAVYVSLDHTASLTSKKTNSNSLRAGTLRCHGCIRRATPSPLNTHIHTFCVELAVPLCHRFRPSAFTPRYRESSHTPWAEHSKHTLGATFKARILRADECQLLSECRKEWRWKNKEISRQQLSENVCRLVLAASSFLSNRALILGPAGV